MNKAVKLNDAKSAKPSRARSGERRNDDSLFAVHVFPSALGGWMVRAIGPRGTRKAFPSQSLALEFASKKAAEKDTRVEVHERLAELKVAPRNTDVVYELVRPRHRR